MTLRQDLADLAAYLDDLDWHANAVVYTDDDPEAVPLDDTRLAAGIEAYREGKRAMTAGW
jgi:hypothetical protein